MVVKQKDQAKQTSILYINIVYNLFRVKKQKSIDLNFIDSHFDSFDQIYQQIENDNHLGNH